MVPPELARDTGRLSAELDVDSRGLYFNQDAQTLKMVQEMSAQPPIPFEKLPPDPNM